MDEERPYLCHDCENDWTFICGKPIEGRFICNREEGHEGVCFSQDREDGDIRRAEMLAEHYRTIRNKALEEAAEIARDFGVFGVAYAILALKEKP